MFRQMRRDPELSALIFCTGFLAAFSILQLINEVKGGG